MSGANGDGTLSLKIDSSQNLILSLPETGTSGNVAVNVPALLDGDDLEVRAVVDAVYTHGGIGRGGSGYEGFIEQRINGCTVSRTAMGGVQAGSDALLQLTSGPYFGSNLGSATAAFPLPIAYFNSAGRTHDAPHAEFLFLGDSLTASHGSTRALCGSLYSTAERWTRAGAHSFAVGGSVIADQKSAFDAATQFHAASYVKAIIVWVGTNDVGASGHSSSTVITALQGLVTDLHSTSPAAKIVVLTLSPNGNWSGGQFTAAQAVNTAILNGTITSVNATVDAYTALNDSNNSGHLRADFDSGDGLHVNNAAHDVVIGLVRAALVTLSLL